MFCVFCSPPPPPLAITLADIQHLITLLAKPWWNGHSPTRLWEHKSLQLLWKSIWNYHKNYKISTVYTTLEDIKKFCIMWNDMYKFILITFFLIAKDWQNTQCLSLGKRLNNPYKWILCNWKKNNVATLICYFGLISKIYCSEKVQDEEEILWCRLSFVFKRENNNICSYLQISKSISST